MFDIVGKLLQKVKDAPKEEMALIDGEINSHAGIAYYPEDASTGADLIYFAEYAASVAKKKGKGQFDVFRKEYAQESHYKYEMLKDLCMGIENAEFEVYYQPIINVRLHKVEKIEALIRWNHPQKGILLPIQFIEIAEESKEIIPLGEYIFKKVVLSLDSFHGTKYDRIPVTFNVSPIQLNHKDFADHIIEIAEDGHADCGRFYIEITEQAILSQTCEAKENLHKFREAGFRIAIDDFGIQYSSLSYLEQLDYDVLKIDSLFTQNINKGKTSLMIFKFIKKLADEFGKECIVEGVETKEQLDQIVDIGFEKIQGYYFAKPMRNDELLDYEYKVLSSEKSKMLL